MASAVAISFFRQKRLDAKHCGRSRIWRGRMNNETDWLLVAAAQTGDMDAFGELYSRHVKKIFVFVLTRVRDPYLAEDLTSETFCRALRKIDSVTYAGTGVDSWLTVIARNLILDHIKSARYRLESTARETPDAPDDSDDPEQAVVKTTIAAERVRYIEQLLSRLRPDYRRCVELRFLYGLTHAQTAAVLEVKESVSKTWQCRALKELAAAA